MKYTEALDQLLAVVAVNLTNTTPSDQLKGATFQEMFVNRQKEIADIVNAMSVGDLRAMLHKLQPPDPLPKAPAQPPQTKQTQTVSVPIPPKLIQGNAGV